MIKRCHILLFLIITTQSLSYAETKHILYVTTTLSQKNKVTQITKANSYSTIQEAINAAESGDTVIIKEGYYNENILIEKSITLRGESISNTIGANDSAPNIDGGATTTPAVITVNGTNTPIHVTLYNLKVSGSGNGVNILQNAIMDIEHVTLQNYYKNGITFGPVLYPGFGNVRGIISHNILIGSGKNDMVSQNGIQISEDNTATITHNQITNHSYAKPDNFWASGILIHNSSHVFINNNILENNQAGINIMEGNYTSILHNTIKGSTTTEAGIRITGNSSHPESAKNNNIAHNNLANNNVGIFMSDTFYTSCHDNQITNSVTTGIYSWNNNEASFTKNKISNVHSENNNGWGMVIDSDYITKANTVTLNTIHLSDFGFWFGEKSKNLITNNIFNNKKINNSNKGETFALENSQKGEKGSTSTSSLMIKGNVLGVSKFIFSQDLKMGDANKDVVELQKFLNQENHEHTKLTGYFGLLTEKSLKLWQKKHNLEENGYLGEITRTRINSTD